MPYIMEECWAGDTYERRVYYDHGHHPKGMKREGRREDTKARIRKANEHRAQTRLRRLINTNFHDGDLSLTLNYRPENRPDTSEQMTVDIRNFLRRLKRRYEKAGKELKYIYVKEVGKKGARHVHLIVNRHDLEEIRQCWQAGGLYVSPLYTQNYEKLSNYLLKYTEQDEEDEGQARHEGKRWNPSKNLKEPKIRKTIKPAKTFRTKVVQKKGYRLVEDSVYSGISDLTGYEYFGYMLIRDGTGG